MQDIQQKPWRVVKPLLCLLQRAQDDGELTDSLFVPLDSADLIRFFRTGCRLQLSTGGCGHTIFFNQKERR